MLKKLVNEAFCTLQITTTGPLLVKSGHASISGPDMTPVLTWRNGKQEVLKVAFFILQHKDQGPVFPWVEAEVDDISLLFRIE